MGTQNDLKYEFQSTLSVRRATKLHALSYNKIIISIHALREESDKLKTIKSLIGIIEISIHALREESDFIILKMIGCKAIFQSTLSVRRATSNTYCIA